MKNIKNRSSKMLRTINQKISVVKSNINKKKIPSSDMFTPIVNSFVPVSRHSVARYFRPKIIDLARYPKRSFDRHTKFSELPRREITSCITVDSSPHLKISKKARSRVEKSSRRPSSAPSSVKHAEEAKIKFMKRAHSEMKALECSRKLYDIDSRFPSSTKAQKSPRTDKKSNKKQVNSRICVEGLPDPISLKCDKRLIEDINPQLFGSLSNSNFSHSPIDGLGNSKKQTKNRLAKRAKKVPEDNRRVQYFISKIPEESLTRLKRGSKKLAASGPLEKSYRKNRDLYCDTNVILEEIPEVETLESTNISRDMAKRRTEEIKKKFLGILREKKSKKDETPNHEETPSQQDQDGSSTSSRPCGETVLRSQSKNTEDADDNDHKTFSEEEKICKKLRNDLDQNIDLQDFLLQFYKKNDTNFEDYSKEFHKLLRRSFFTVSLDESRNNSSVYETCKTHLSGDDLIFSTGRKPPPPTPTNEDSYGVKVSNDEISKCIQEKTSSFHQKVEHVLSAYQNLESSKISRTLATEDEVDSLQYSPRTSTFARHSGNMSTEDKTDVFQNSQMSAEEAQNKLEEENNGDIGDTFIEQVCEVDVSNYVPDDDNFVPLQRRVKKIPSISDTYIDQTIPFDDESTNKVKVKNIPSKTDRKICAPNNLSGKVQNGRNKQLRLPKSRWRSAPTIPRKMTSSSNCSTPHSQKSKQLSKRSKNLSTASNNSHSINSNMELLSEDSCCNVDSANFFSKTSIKRKGCLSETSSLSGSASELLEESKKALEKLMKCINESKRVSRRENSLNDILRDLSKLDEDDTFKRVIGESEELCYPFESMKKDGQSSDSDIFVAKDNTGFIKSHPNKKLRYSGNVHLKSPSESYRISRESFPDGLEEMLCEKR